MVFSWMHWKNILEYSSSSCHGNHSIKQQILTVSCKYYGNAIVKEVNDQRSNELRETLMWQLYVPSVMLPFLRYYPVY